ncbi:cell cycle checkpoint control protein RAD9B isoform X2 [Girardinichthys multiradiatus]|uniref:cell cycle checkpoint control protein RAD9B isoform X2 n=1 Tax=Girardinichthys multiradiatus TaxID=208333 RepID=UPI001FAB9239|nr:cell cycle checkpoint control protein RAD9B isoform X2 [Girardinichthys multiradiatus]
MNSIIEGKNVKVFGKAIIALSRIGDELWLDPMVKGLALRSVNSAHSAYGGFLFSPLFFQQYSLGSVLKQGSEVIKCKLLMKSVLPLFRSLTSIERSVERCLISVSTATDRVIIQFFCRHGIIKTHNIHFQESEALQAVFASHLCPNVLKAPGRLFADLVMHFPLFQEEITLSITAIKVSLRNDQDGGKGHMKTMYTEMSLHPDEFDYFQIGLDSDITFCLKELRGILSFAESHSLSVSVYLGAAGKPVCFSVEDGVLEATVLLATLMDSESNDRSPAEPLSPTTLRCENSSAQPVDVFEEPSSMHHNIPDEMIASSQAGTIISSPKRMRLHPQIMGRTCLGVASKECSSASTSPASTKVCSLLFKALSSEQDAGGRAARLPVLACYSDEENPDDNHPRSSSR